MYIYFKEKSKMLFLKKTRLFSTYHDKRFGDQINKIFCGDFSSQPRAL